MLKKLNATKISLQAKICNNNILGHLLDHSWLKKLMYFRSAVGVPILYHLLEMHLQGSAIIY